MATATGSAAVTEQRQASARSLLHGRRELTVLSAMSPQQPDDLLAALIDVARANGCRLRILLADLEGAYKFLDAASLADVRSGQVRLVSVAGAVPAALSDYVDYFPASLWSFDQMLARRTIEVDLLVARVHETAKPGVLSYGQMVGYTTSALESAAAVCFEVAPPASFPPSPALPADAADIAYAVPADPPPKGRDRRPPSAEQAAIAGLIAALLPDGATVQLGLGAVPDAVAGAWQGRSDLRLHSGILPPSVALALAAGLFADSDPVATGVMPVPLGSPPWPDRVRLLPVSQTHSTDTLEHIPRLWAINSAFDIDLHGQVNAEYVAGTRLASGGGQADFFRAAHRSVGGASVLALPSRARDGSSRIRATIAPPHVATLAGSDLDYVVTEHGVAHLTGLTAAERAEALILVADPQDRAALAATAVNPRSGPHRR
jgi:4-hydroxybutyrate CoA-transferase